MYCFYIVKFYIICIVLLDKYNSYSQLSVLYLNWFSAHYQSYPVSLFNLLPTFYHQVEFSRRVHKYYYFMTSFTGKAVSLSQD